MPKEKEACTPRKGFWGALCGPGAWGTSPVALGLPARRRSSPEFHQNTRTFRRTSVVTFRKTLGTFMPARLKVF